MDHLTSWWDHLRSYALWYRRMTYYYIGFKMHELRLATPSRHTSAKLSAVKTNDIPTIQTKVFSGEWGVDDVVSVNNMTTILHEAVVMDRREIAQFALRQGADPNIRDRNGMTPLIKAAALGREFMVVELLKCGVNPGQRDPHGFNAYQKAMLHEEWKVAELLSQVREVKGETKWMWPPEI